MRKPKTENKNQLREVKPIKLSPAQKRFKKILKQDTHKKQKALDITLGVVTTLVGAFLLYNMIADTIYNSQPPSKDPFVVENVWENNDNNIEFDNNGNIVTDKMTETDRQIIASQIGGLVLQDANSRCDTPIEKVTDILTISLLPYNLCDEDNEFDKYYLSILFSDDESTYTLNYFTGQDFYSEAESEKDYFADFINFVNYDCALDNCEKISEIGSSIKDALGDDILHVGEAYLGYRENGWEYYYIPAYHKDGRATVYSTFSQTLDGYDLDPMESFFEQITDENSEKVFKAAEYEPTENLNKVMQILEDVKSATDANNESDKQDSLAAAKNNFKTLEK